MVKFERGVQIFIFYVCDAGKSLKSLFHPFEIDIGISLKLEKNI
jgi:hypothetical protein